ncbi:hypothetical protein Moror_10135 [Moniliophthora roreri MCA 2997]|uniref:Uncharacterized protein n=2 Tax=Moniliophthora roreri TaxID=221103 RepID=V2WV56_MONRO|nr:hypothetical protein Moror_10135 [Moniliophthora roreri MCA 2997]KAI3605060.1 hypothetical protein WG66_001909 [Moniliophthora roreri]
MSYQILGRTIKSEYLALSVMGSAIGGALLATRGGKKEPAVPSGSSKSVIEKVKESVPIAAGSSEEEQLIASIKNFIAEAEKEASGSKH